MHVPGAYVILDEISTMSPVVYTSRPRNIEHIIQELWLEAVSADVDPFIVEISISSNILTRIMFEFVYANLKAYIECTLCASLFLLQLLILCSNIYRL